MKHTIIFSAFVVVLATATFGTAQSSSLRVSFSESTDTSGGGQGAGKVSVHDAPYNPNFQIFEVLVPVSTTEQCFAATDFSRARLVGPDRATLSYDPSGATYEITIVAGIRERDNCRVILVGETAATAGYNVWRANFGRTSLAEEDLTKGEEDGVRMGDGSVRSVSYQVAVTRWE